MVRFAKLFDLEEKGTQFLAYCEFREGLAVVHFVFSVSELMADIRMSFEGDDSESAALAHLDKLTRESAVEIVDKTIAALDNSNGFSDVETTAKNLE